MRLLLTILTVSLLLTLFGCKEDPPVPDNVFTLRLDQGENLSPFLPDGTFETAVRFESSVLGNAAGGKLFEVEAYIFEIPQNLMVKVYRGSVVDSPMTLIHQQDASTGLSSQAWNTFSLTDSIEVLAGEDLWIAMRFTQSDNQRIMGCDQGPAVTNGDWFFDTQVGAWQTYREATSNATDINWNIRGKVLTD